jgi:hypothetical protein
MWAILLNLAASTKGKFGLVFTHLLVVEFKVNLGCEILFIQFGCSNVRLIRGDSIEMCVLKIGC